MTDWFDTLQLHISKQISAKGRAQVELSGFRADVRQIGESWLWNVTDAATGAQGTSLASGCESAPETATNKAANAMSKLIQRGF